MNKQKAIEWTYGSSRKCVLRGTCTYLVNCLDNYTDTNYLVIFAVNSFELVDGKVDDGVSFDADDGKVDEGVGRPVEKLLLHTHVVTPSLGYPLLNAPWQGIQHYMYTIP